MQTRMGLGLGLGMTRGAGEAVPPPSSGIDFVGAKTATVVGSTATNTTISLTDLAGGIATSPANGDLVIVAYATSPNSVDRAIGVVTAGYTEIEELYAPGTPGSNLSLNTKFMSSTPDTEVLVGPTGSTFERGVVLIQVWRGVNAVTTLDVASIVTIGSGSSLPNPGAITPITTGAVVSVFGAGGNALTGTFSSSDLDNFNTATFGTSSRHAIIGGGSLPWTGGAVDPAAFGIVTASDDPDAGNIAVTLALRPA